MSIKKRIFLFSSLIVFLIANIGVGIYTHTCKVSGTDTSFFFQAEDSCADHAHQEEIEVVHACCTKDLVVKDAGCCSTNTNYVQLDVDLSSSVEKASFVLSPIVVINSHSLFESESFVEKTVSTSFIHSPPPLLQGRDFQSIFQVYTI